MTYNHKLAHDTALEWGLDVDIVEQWRTDGIIPDEYALHKNEQTPGRISRYESFILLSAQGYLKAEYVCRLMQWNDRRISNALAWHRNPDANDYRRFYGEEIDELTAVLLDPLRVALSIFLLDAWVTPADQPYSDELYQQFAHLIADNPALNPSRLTLGRTDSERKQIRNLLSGTTRRLPQRQRELFTSVLIECQRIVTILTVRNL